MLKIGDFSRIAQVTVKTLRYYDRLGLLHPAQVDPFTGHRYYTMAQLPNVNRIRSLKAFGLSLTNIQRIIEDNLSPDEFRGMLQLRQVQLLAEIETAQSRLHRIDAHLKQLSQEGTMPQYDVTLKAIVSQRVLAIREQLASADEIEHLFTEIAEALKAQHINSTGAWIALYHHEGFRDTNLDVEIAVPVDDNITDTIALDNTRQLTIHTTQAYEQAATVIQNGHDADWSGDYGALGHFMEHNHYQSTGAVREVYLTSPDDDAGWLIELQLPIS